MMIRTSKTDSKKSILKMSAKSHLSLLLLTVLLFDSPWMTVMANPRGGDVVMGQAVIHTESDTKTTISQTTDKAVINWQQFNIGTGEWTRFDQPSKTSVTLNRVKGQDPSLILGNMSANGQVFLVNPNGIVFGKDSRIDVSALVASTADITNENFMAGRYEFSIPGNPTAQIINYGSINAEQGGLVALVAPRVYNQGYIAAKLGRVILAGADIFTLDLYGDDLISLQISGDLLAYAQTADGQSLKQIVSNSGTIQADGGYVLLTTDVAKNVLDQVINMDGYVIARTAEQKNGTIVLKGGDSAEINIAGTIDASAVSAAAPYAGEVRITAGEIIRLNPDAQVLAH
jgi:filamentous hemagglutinin family protein